MDVVVNKLSRIEREKFLIYRASTIINFMIFIAPFIVGTVYFFINRKITIKGEMNISTNKAPDVTSSSTLFGVFTKKFKNLPL